MFEQIITWHTSCLVEKSGVLNFRVEDISYFHADKDFASLLIKGSKVYYTVKCDDLKKIIDKTQSNKD